MKRLLLAAALPVLLFACAKEDDVNPPFREPSCQDTTDDGRFEAFSPPEAAQFLKWFRVVPDSADTSVVRYQYINGRTLYNRAIDYLPYVGVKVKKPAKLFAFMPTRVQQEQYYSWVVNLLDTSAEYKVNLYHLREYQPQFQPGCYRVYYVISDTDTGVVYNKGHYDIEIKN